MAKSFQDIMAEARKEIPEASPQQVNELLKNNGKSPILLDVRESDEWRQGHLEGAIPLPRGFLEIKVETAIPDKNTPIVAYCAGGVRSLLAAKVMREMGYQNVTSMAGGYGAWKNGGFKWVQDLPLQVGNIDHVVVDDAQCADTGRRKIVSGRRAQAAGANHQDFCLQ